MDLRQLRYYARIVELESMTAAALSLHIAQPSLSQHVAKLEQDLDTQLLIRGHSGARPTETGQILYRHAKSVLLQVDEARAAVKYGRDVPSGRVSVGLPTSASQVVALPLMQQVAELMPEVTLELIEGSSSYLAEAVAMQKMDMAILMNASPQANTRTTALLDEELLLMGPFDDESPEVFTLEALSRLPLILPSYPNSIRVVVERAMAQAGLAVQLVAETSAVSILLSSAQRGRCYTILPWSALASVPYAQAAKLARPIAYPDMTRHMSLSVSGVAATSVSCSAVEAALIQLVARLVDTDQWRRVTPHASLSV